MVEITPSKFTSVWQTAFALPVALVGWLLGVLLGGVFFSVVSSSPLVPEKGISEVWFLSAAAWIGVYVAHQACGLLFRHYIQRVVFMMFVVIAIYNFAAEVFSNQVIWDQISRFFQGIVTVLTAYAFFWHRERSRISD